MAVLFVLASCKKKTAEEAPKPDRSYRLTEVKFLSTDSSRTQYPKGHLKAVEYFNTTKEPKKVHVGLDSLYTIWEVKSNDLALLDGLEIDSSSLQAITPFEILEDGTIILGNVYRPFLINKEVKISSFHDVLLPQTVAPGENVILIPTVYYMVMSADFVAVFIQAGTDEKKIVRGTWRMISTTGQTITLLKR